MVTLTGPGGVGKTRLAAELAARLTREDSAPAATVDLADLEDPALIFSALVEQLGLSAAADETSLVDLIIRELADGPRLLVLDNCEHLIEELRGYIAQLLVTSTDLVVVATSRQPLRVGGERVWRVEPLRVPPLDAQARPVDLLEFPSVRLFVDRARAVNRHFRIEEANAAAVADISRRVDGLPLAIELAAAWTPTLSAAEIGERLSQDLGLLRSAPGEPDRHETLRTLFVRSYSLLTAPERMVFDRLGPFVGFSAEMAEVVCGPSLGGTVDVVDVLARLVDKSLLVVGDHLGRARYRRLAPARAFGAELLNGLPDAREVRSRHAEWFAQLAEASLAEPNSKALRDLEMEHDNFTAAMTWAASENLQLALRLFVALGPFWQTGGRVGEGRRWADSLVGPDRDTRSVDPVILARALETAGNLALAVGHYEQAGDWLAAALSTYEKLGDRSGTGRVLAGLGVLARYRGDLERAEELITEAAGRLEGEPTEASCLAELGLVKALSGREAEGERTLLRALDLAHERDDTSTAADALNNLGKLASVRGSLEIAERHHEQALQLHREMRRLRAEARTLGYLGEICSKRQQFDRATSLYDQAMSVQTRLGDQRGMATSLGRLAFVSYQRGRPATSATLYRQLLELRRRMGDRRGEAAALVGLATAVWLGDPTDIELEETRALVDRGVQLHRQSGDLRGLAWALYTQGEITRDHGDLPAARAAATEALEIHRRLGESAWTTLGLHTLATLALAEGDPGEARPLLLEATAMALAAGVPIQQLRCVEVGAHLALVEGRLDLSALLYGAGQAGREALDQPPPRRAQRATAEEDDRTLRRELTAEVVEALQDDGRRLSIEEACGLVLDDGPSRRGRPAGEPAGGQPLWSIRLFGEFSVEVEGHPVPLRGRALSQVIKITALRRRVPVDELVELLWPEAAPGVGRRRLNNVLARLRRATGSLVVRDGDTLALAPPVTVDVDLFVDLSQTALASVSSGSPDAPALCRQAAALYRGELLMTDRYEDWAAAPRVRLARVHLDLLDALAEEAARSGRPAEAVQWMERGIEAEPLDLARYQRAAELASGQGWQHRAWEMALRARRIGDKLGVDLPSDLARLLSR